jgi:hypothetical protein
MKQLLTGAALNQALVSAGDDDATRRLTDAVRRDGTCGCGGPVWHGQAAMRIGVSRWATTEANVERSRAAMLRTAIQQRR